jgi:phosphoribosylanthranilate isomerase
MPKIKICGLTRPEDIDIVNEVLPDYIGFVFAPSRRQVTPGAAAALKQRLDDRIKAVGVFVNGRIDEIARLRRHGIIDLIQLHGDEDEGYVAGLKERVDAPVIKAVRVRNPEQVSAAARLPCEFLLLDTYQKDAYGGTGAAFDYSLIPPLQKPYFLAGGLQAGNIRAVVSHRPYCLDVSSGVETESVKDAAKVREIVRLVREME